MTTMDRMVQAVRRNPEGLLLLGAGVALVLRGSMGKASSGGSDYSMGRAGFRPASMPERSDSSLGQSLRDGVSDMQDAVSDVAQDLAGKATDIGHAAADRAKRLTGDARSSVEDIVEAQPIAVAIAGVAVGCLAAAFLPTSRIENETLRPLGKQAVDALSNAGERVKDAAIKAGEQLKGAAAERGLNKQGFAEVARDVASDFKSNVVGGNEPKAPASESASYGR